MKTMQQRLVTTLMILRNESSSSINCNRKNIVTITFLPLNIGELFCIYLKSQTASLDWLSDWHFRDFSFQCFKFHSIIFVRTISAIFELFLPVHRPSPTDSWCVSNGSIHHFGAAHIHSDCQCAQGDHWGFCEFQWRLKCHLNNFQLHFSNRNATELMMRLTIGRLNVYRTANGWMLSGRICQLVTSSKYRTTTSFRLILFNCHQVNRKGSPSSKQQT